MISDRQRLYQGVSCAAWAYFFLYFDLNFNGISVLPDFVCYLLLWQAISFLEGEERDLALLRPLCLLLGVWVGLAWGFTLLGDSLDGRLSVADLLISAAAIYFHFQLFTDFAHLAARYQSEGMELDRRLLRLRTVQTVLLTASSLLGGWLPSGIQLFFPGSALAEETVSVLLVALALAGVVVSLRLMFGLCALRKCFLPSEDKA